MPTYAAFQLNPGPKFFVNFMGWDSDAETVRGFAADFNAIILSTSSGKFPSPPSDLHDINPTVMVLGYLNTFDCHEGCEIWGNEDWFYHAPDGSRINVYMNAGYTNRYGLNYANADYREWYKNKTLGYVAGGYDGVLMDNLMDFYYYGRENRVTSYLPYCPYYWNDSCDQFAAENTGFLQYVNDNSPSEVVYMPNGIYATHIWQYAYDYAMAADGGHSEVFTDVSGGRSYPTVSQLRDMIELFYQIDQAGKLGMQRNIGNNTEKEAVFAYSLYLMTQQNSTYFFYANDGDMRYATFVWYSEYRADIGIPIGKFYESSGLFLREYSNGLVIANPQSYSINFDLGSAYQTVDDQTVSSVSLTEHEGIVLLSSGTGCSENWNCTDWGTCVGGTQTRTCTDLAGCGTTNNKPPESQSCQPTQGCIQTNNGIEIPDDNIDQDCDDYDDTSSSYGYKVWLDRPRIYIHEEEIVKLRAWAGLRPDGSTCSGDCSSEFPAEHQPYWAASKDYYDILNNNLGSLINNIPSYALMYVLTGDSSHCDTAASLIASTDGEALAMAFDWCYDVLTDTQKTDFANALVSIGNSGIVDWAGGRAPTHINCDAAGDVSELPFAAVSLYGQDTANSIYFLDEFSNYYLDESYSKAVIPNWDETGGGGHMLGGGYDYDNGLDCLLMPLHILSVGTDQDVLNSSEHLKNAGLFYLYNLPSGFNGYNYYVPLGDGDLGYGATHQRIIIHQAYAYRDSYTQWLQKQLDNVELRYKDCASGNYCSAVKSRVWRDMLWDDPSLQMVHPQDLPDVRFFDSRGAVYMRSGWDFSGTSSTDIWSDFRVSKNDVHLHADQGAFRIWRGDDRLAIDSGYYDYGGCSAGNHYNRYYRQTISDNSLLINMPGEIWEHSSCGNFTTYGGQKKSGGSGALMGSRQPGGDYARGFIDRFEDSADYAYSYGDFTKAYSDTGDDQGADVKTDQVQRAYLYLKPDVFVVFDRVNAIDSSYKKTWLLHTAEMPAIEDSGNWAQGTENSYGGTAGMSGTDIGHLSASTGNSKLYIDVLLPSEHTITKIGGPDSSGNYNTAGAYEFYVDGSNAFSIDPIGPQNGRWRIEVSPQNPSEFDNFLHVLYPTSSSGTMFPTSSIESSNGELIGALIEKSGNPWVTMFGKTGDVSGYPSYEFTTNLSGIKNMVADMEPNTVYNITIERDGVPSTKIVTSSANGVIYFTT